MISTEFKSVIELVKAFPDEQTCIAHLERLRWNGVVVSPFDEGSKVYKCSGNKYKCKNTGKYFNVRTATLFDNTKIELQTWFVAIYLVTAHKKGISSLQLSRDLNVTQKTAWFMLQRIRNCFGLDNTDENGQIGGGGQLVEIDETYVGGKLKNKSNKVRKMHADGIIDGRNYNKTAIMGYAVRGGDLTLKVMEHKNHMQADVLETVSPEAVIVTDESNLYHKMGTFFAGHEKVSHSKQEYVKGAIHTNSIEGAFSMFDRMVIGTYHYISAKHMQKYANELTFRYNSRAQSECARFNLLLANCSNRLTYKSLICK